MKHLLLIFSALLIMTKLTGQDLIIKESGDTVRCKITSIDSSTLFLKIKKGNDYVNTLISRDKVKAYHYNAYDATIKVQTAADWKSIKLKFNLNIGTGYILSEDPLPLGDLSTLDYKTFDNLRLGQGFGGDIEFYFLRFLGIGVKYNLFQSRTNLDESFREQYKFQYVGPSICLMGVMLNNTSIARFSLTGGKMYLDHLKNGISDSTSGGISDYEIKSETYAFGGTVGFDFLLDGSFAFGIESTVLFGNFDKYNITATEMKTKTKTSMDLPGQKFKTVRLDLNVGMKFYF